MKNRALRYCGTLTGLIGTLLLVNCQDSDKFCVTNSDGTGCKSVDLVGESTLALRSAEPAGDNCQYGGVRIDTGFDLNGNGQLDTTEIDISAYVCNGTPGSDGATGATGSSGEAGANGHNSLLSVTAFSGEAHDCTTGGLQVDTGSDDGGTDDTADDGILGSSEVDGTQYLCNDVGVAGPAGPTGVGATGATGAPGADGDPGATGATGAMGPAGADGATGATGASGVDGATGATGATGASGVDGATGATGATGASGVDGATGATGATGADGSGSVVAFASGLPGVMTTSLGGLSNTSTLVGFGNSSTGQTITAGTIDLTGGAGILQNFAFSVPRDGTLTSIDAYFSTTSALSLVGTTITVTAQVYESTTPDNTFTVIPGASVTLAPPLTGVLSSGTIESGITTGLSIPVTAGTRLLLVFTPEVTAGLDVSTTIPGYMSGGITVN